MTPLEQIIGLLHDRGLKTKRTGRQWKAQCPAHEDKDPSLSLGEGDDLKLLAFCHAGCDTEAIARVLGMSMSDFFVSDETKAGGDRTVDVYDYHDEQGTLVFQVVRQVGKQFRQRRPDGTGGWIWNLEGVTRIPYRLPQLRKAIANNRAAFIVEGEKDVATLLGLLPGGPAVTTNPMGAGKWRSEYPQWFEGADRVYIIADNDQPGRDHARDIARSLIGVAKVVKIVELPIADKGGDVTDWVRAGGTSEQLSDLVKAADPWQPDWDLHEAPTRLVDGWDFIRSATAQPPAIWGRGDEILWARGEALIIAAPTGVGKTTLEGNILEGRLFGGDVLGSPIEQLERPHLYIAADRPAQIARRLQTILADDERRETQVRSQMKVWKGPLPFDLAKEQPEALAEFVEGHGCGSVTIDSLGDLFLNLSSDETGGRVKQMYGATMAAEIQLSALHHHRKAQVDNKKPNKIGDVFGSQWITAGAGSVLFLWGEAGDPYLELLHLKHPASPVGPITLYLDHETGSITVDPDSDPLGIARRHKDGITASGLAQVMFGTVDKKTTERARRKLKRLTDAGLIRPAGEPGPRGEVAYKETGLP